MVEQEERKTKHHSNFRRSASTVAQYISGAKTDVLHMDMNVQYVANLTTLKVNANLSPGISTREISIRVAEVELMQ